jgi:cold shock CspA family protein
MQGIVVHYNGARGFGFLYSDEIKRRVFFHVTEFTGAKVPSVNQFVEFELARDKRSDKDKAIKITVLEPTAGLDALKNGMQVTPETGTVVIKAGV